MSQKRKTTEFSASKSTSKKAREMNPVQTEPIFPVEEYEAYIENTDLKPEQVEEVVADLLNHDPEDRTDLVPLAITKGRYQWLIALGRAHALFPRVVSGGLSAPPLFKVYLNCGKDADKFAAVLKLFPDSIVFGIRKTLRFAIIAQEEPMVLALIRAGADFGGFKSLEQNRENDDKSDMKIALPQLARNNGLKEAVRAMICAALVDESEIVLSDLFETATKEISAAEARQWICRGASMVGRPF